MRREYFLFFAVISIFISASFTLSAGAAAADARKVMEGVYNQDTSRDASWRGLMDVYDKKGNVRQKKFFFRRLGSYGNGKTLVRFTEPAEVRGVGLLSINEKGEKERQWLYTPAIERTRRIAPQERSRRFLGTDFTHEDMEERVIDDFEYKLLSEGDVIDGQKTYKIESKPLASNKSQYKTIYSWVRQDIPVTVLSELYDEKDQKIRVYHATDFVKISGVWLAKSIEMSTTLDSTKTILKFDDIKLSTGLKEDLFSLQSLEKGDLF